MDLSEKILDGNKEQNYNLDDWKDIYKLIMHEEEEVIRKNITSHINKIIEKIQGFKVLLLCRSIGIIDDLDADRIYSNISKGDKDNILLIINSAGGRIEPAYLISKCCKEYAKEKFIVSIPRRAKSAATLIALGADEIHMGPLSEIGPIDPQMRSGPALSLSSALEYLAILCTQYPKTSNMFAEYLARTLPLHALGYYQRISESAEHYAIRLLQSGNKVLKNKDVKQIAHKFVYEYKDHSFVIGKDEAMEIFGDNIIKVKTNEYAIGNQIYDFLEKINLIFGLKKKVYNLIGSCDDLDLMDIPEQKF